MSIPTTNYNLKKWDLINDIISQVATDQNDNMDIIDGRLLLNQDALNNLQNQINNIVSSPAPSEAEIIQARNGYVNLLVSVLNSSIFRATVDPTGSDDGYAFWANTTNNTIFARINGTNPNAIWREIDNDTVTDIIGELSNLDTTDKTSIVNAINELVANLAEKANIQSGATENNFVTFNVNGDIKDSGNIKTIDGTLSGNSDNNIPSEKAVKTYADSRIVTGIYTGNGTASMTVTLGFTPTAVFVNNSSGQTGDDDGASTLIYGGLAVTGSPLLGSALTIVSGGFTVSQGGIARTNGNTFVYNYIAIR